MIKETFLSAVRGGNLASWPGLTTKLVLKYFPDLKETQKGHMKGQQKGIQSTKVRKPAEIKIKPGTEHIPLAPITQQEDIFVFVMDLADTIHTDQTGAFPMTSQRGYMYIMVGIHLDANYIYCNLMKNRTEDEMISAYQRTVGRMEVSGLGLKHHQLDNECSEKFK